MLKAKTSVLLFIAAVILAGCANRHPLLYSWGSYENQIYATYADPGKVPFEEQLQNLERDYQRARAANKPVPPGYHAYVGYLYFQLGKADAALQSFQTEKALFPESGVYMNLLISRITITGQHGTNH